MLAFIIIKDCCVITGQDVCFCTFLSDNRYLSYVVVAATANNSDKHLIHCELSVTPDRQAQ